MTPMSEGPDRDLHSLFRETNRDLSDEPFVTSTLGRIESRRFRRTLVRHLLQAICLVGIATLSRYLIQASAWLSEGLGYLLGLQGASLATPSAAAITALCVLCFLLSGRLMRRWLRPLL